ncbi:unnamed protein product [Vitrella brassicaformis CCMP3155]|uniref:Pterin-binding domain-containing protein n=1 Tax=Vitrella brassicaformis (strain CCMP3155) TaxID=1169540 RepID=A0A0G4FI55_VITBC|nr:unnamed protein product [Vitrella brassicaformis CCMP3155]|eukprot:CEM13179.1 unnamed protein product [Vitrella brassicaformis CCMP3155]
MATSPAAHSSGAGHRAFIALGSNLGGPLRLHYIEEAIKELKGTVGSIESTSCLYETPPAYVDPASMPPFLNAAVAVRTAIGDPSEVVRRLKAIEARFGRRRDSHGRRGEKRQYVARTIDMDLLFLDDAVCLREDDPLWVEVPHPRLHERNFVLEPLMDIDPHFIHPALGETISSLWDSNREQASEKGPEDGRTARPRRVFAVGSRLWQMDDGGTPRIMGILNVTPDSFSDGSVHNASVEDSVKRALEMEDQGADIIDIGGESTRPGAVPPSEEEEMRRVLPVIRRLKEESSVPISVDTRRAVVAQAAVEAGADLVNDVSGGVADSQMWPLLEDYIGRRDYPRGVSYCLMHMRGNPDTMTKLTDYQDVSAEVAMWLKDRCERLMQRGIPRWRILADVGIGFAKTAEQSYRLLRDLGKVQCGLPRGIPQLVGFSRKRLLGATTAEGKARRMLKRESEDQSTPPPQNGYPSSSLAKRDPQELEDRKWGGAACTAWCVQQGVFMLRTHDINETRCVVDVMQKIMNT